MLPIFLVSIPITSRPQGPRHSCSKSIHMLLSCVILHDIGWPGLTLSMVWNHPKGHALLCSRDHQPQATNKRICKTTNCINHHLGDALIFLKFHWFYFRLTNCPIEPSILVPCVSLLSDGMAQAQQLRFTAVPREVALKDMALTSSRWNTSRWGIDFAHPSTVEW